MQFKLELMDNVDWTIEFYKLKFIEWKREMKKKWAAASSCAHTPIKIIQTNDFK